MLFGFPDEFQVGGIGSVKSGRGLPQSKTWRTSTQGRWTRDSVVECASPLALSDAGRAFDPPRVFLRAAALRIRFPLQRFNFSTLQLPFLG